MDEALALPRVELLPLSPAVAVMAAGLDRSFHADPADRILVATTVLESARLVTKDRKIREHLEEDAVW
jgi:PIN domain nuclease of toxin-antitoxin system